MITVRAGQATEPAAVKLGAESSKKLTPDDASPRKEGPDVFDSRRAPKFGSGQGSTG